MNQILKVVMGILFTTFIGLIIIGSLMGEGEEPTVEEFSQEQIEMLESMVEINPTIPKSTQEYPSLPKPTQEYPVEEPYIYLDIPMEEEMQEFCQERCRFYKVSYPFFLAIIESESTFGTNVVNPDNPNVVGPMQISTIHAGEYGELDIYDTYDNIEIGIRMLGEYLEKYMEADQVIMAYKGGEYAMLEWVEEGITLSVCDVITDRIMFWQKEVEGRRNEQGRN